MAIFVLLLSAVAFAASASWPPVAVPVGILLTGPLYTLSIAVLYRDFFLEKGDTYAAKPGPPFTDF